MANEVTLNDREVAAVLAGLRFVQRAHGDGSVAATVAEILTDYGRLKPLSNAEIDALCERLNIGLVREKGGD